MDTLPYAPLFGTLALALLWSALFSAVDAARLQLNGSLRNGDDGQAPCPLRRWCCAPAWASCWYWAWPA